MTRSIYAQNSFVSGVLEPRLLGRTDIAQYSQGLQQADNVLILPQGGFRLAPGLVFVETSPEKDGGGFSAVRMFEFEVSAVRSYLLVFTDAILRVYRDGAFLVEINNGTQAAELYLEENLTEINEAQIDNVMILIQKKQGFRRLVAPDDDQDDAIVSNWTFDIPPMIAPQINYNDDLSPIPVSNNQNVDWEYFIEGDVYRLSIDGIVTEDVIFSDNIQSHIKNLTTALLNHPLLGNSGVAITLNSQDINVKSSYRIILSGSSAGDFETFTGYAVQSKDPNASISASTVAAGTSQKEDAWSVLRGYPRTITFFAGRMYLGNLIYRKSSVFGSRSGDLFNFELDVQADDDAIFATLATDTLNEITNLISGRSLQIFTTGAEFYVPTEIPTPSNFEVRSQTNHGTSFINPVQIDGATLFLERKGKSLREFLFTFQEDSYSANSVSILAQHLIIDPVDMDAQKGTASDDANYVILCNSDGTVTLLNTLRSQGIAGFTRRLTPNGKAVAVAVVDDVAYFTIERVIDGVTIRNIEFWTFDSLTDSSVIETFGVPTSLITGLNHLEGQTVKVVADGAVLLDKVVVGGEVTLERKTTTLDLGLWQTPVIIPMPLAGDGGTGINQMRIKSVPRTSIRLYETSTLRFDDVTLPRRKFQPAINSPLNTPPPVFTGIEGDLEINEGWLRQQAPIITQEQPGPMTVLAITYELEAR